MRQLQHGSLEWQKLLPVWRGVRRSEVLSRIYWKQKNDRSQFRTIQWHRLGAEMSDTWKREHPIAIAAAAYIPYIEITQLENQLKNPSTLPPISSFMDPYISVIVEKKFELPTTIPPSSTIKHHHSPQKQLHHGSYAVANYSTSPCNPHSRRGAACSTRVDPSTDHGLEDLS